MHHGLVFSAYPCVCCGYLTMAGRPGSYELCPVCGWQDDLQQLRWPAMPRGANKLSLIDAQRDPVARGTADVDRERAWRPIAAGRDRFEPSGRMLAPWPDDYTIFYWWRRRTGTTWWTGSVPSLLNEAVPDDAAFADAVRAATTGLRPADGNNLAGMSMDFDAYLWRCPSIREVAVTSGPNPARQVVARCVAHPWAAPAVVADELLRAWLDDLRYQHWEAHLLRHTPVSVRLDVATKPSEAGYVVTGLIVAVW